MESKDREAIGIVAAVCLSLLGVLLVFEERSNDWLLNAPFDLEDHDLYLLDALPILGAIYFLFRRHWFAFQGWLWGYILSLLGFGVFTVSLYSAFNHR